jgi:hypothetical protein
MKAKLLSENGQIGGIEAVPFSILIFVVGMIMAINGWGVVHTQTNARSAARAAVRVFVEQNNFDLAQQKAHATAIETLRRSGFATDRASIAIDFPNGDTWHRCARVRIVVSLPTRTFPAPFVGSLFSWISVRAAESGLVDAYRSGIDGGEAICQ